MRRRDDVAEYAFIGSNDMRSMAASVFKVVMIDRTVTGIILLLIGMFNGALMRMEYAVQALHLECAGEINNKQKRNQQSL